MSAGEKKKKNGKRGHESMGDAVSCCHNDEALNIGHGQNFDSSMAE